MKPMKVEISKANRKMMQAVFDKEKSFLGSTEKGDNIEMIIDIDRSPMLQAYQKMKSTDNNNYANRGAE